MTELVLRRAIGIMCVRLGWTQDDLEECAHLWLPFYAPSQAWAFMNMGELEELYQGLRDLEHFKVWLERRIVIGRPRDVVEPTRAPTVFGRLRK